MSSFGQVSALGFEALIASQDLVVPIEIPEDLSGNPLNPMLFPANWSGLIEVESRWQTDVTRPVGSNRTERTALFARPVRRMRARFTGMEKRVSHAIAQAAMKYSDLHGMPVPLYCDGVQVTSTSGTTIYGNFSKKRFFEGARVAVMVSRHGTTKSEDRSFLATLQEVAPDYIKVDVLERAVTSSDRVYPCFDAERIESPSVGTALTDTVWETEIEWNEVEGICTLPALWPATGSGDASVLSPICDVLDDLPVFPFEPDYSDGVEVLPARDLEHTSSGRSTIAFGDGSPYHRFGLNVMGFDRDRIWSILRFFDSMQGRRGTFYLIHPTRPWEPYTTLVPSVGQCRIMPVGDADAIERYFRRVVLTRADGTMVTRAVDEVSDNSDHFAITFTEDLPDTDFVSAQPIFTCNFENDSIVETWATDETIPALALSIVEVPDASSVTQAAVEEQLGFGTLYPKFLSLDGLNLLLRAGAGCYADDGTPSKVWPGTPGTGESSHVALWVDESAGPDRQNRPPLFEKTASARTDYGFLIRPTTSWENNKQPMVLSPDYDIDFMLDTNLPGYRRRLWSSDGWTFCICITPHKYYAGFPTTRPIIELATASATVFGLYVDHATAGWANKAGVVAVDAASGAHSDELTVDIYEAFDYDFPLIFTVRVDSASGKLWVWVNGDQALATALSVPSGMFLGGDYVTARFGNGLSQGHFPSAGNTQYGVGGNINLIASYDNPLSLDDIQAMHTMVASAFRTRDVPISFYA